jgi:3-oxoacyl-[acyl-carrier protein] reductase
MLGAYIAEHMAVNRIRGVIVNISSICADGNAGQTAYSASKAGLESMTKVWAKELGSFGIRSIAIAPGFMDTESTHVALAESVLEEIRLRTPLRKLGKVSQVTHAIKFALTNDFVNAGVIRVDGGLTI